MLGIIMAAAIGRVTPSPAAARSILDSSLKDYPTARFKMVMWVETPDQGPGYCGFINSKDGASGYSGWTPFKLTFTGEHTPSLFSTADEAPWDVQGACEGMKPYDTLDHASELAYRAP